MSEVFIDNKYQGGFVGDLETLTSQFQRGDINNPLDEQDIAALESSQKNIDLIIDNKIPLTDEAKFQLNSLLKFHDEDYVNKFRSTYFTPEEVDSLSVSQPSSEITPNAHERLWKALADKELYSGDYNKFKEQFSKPETQERLFKSLKAKKLYSKSAGDFMNTFFPAVDELKEEAIEEVKTEEVETTKVPPGLSGSYYEKPKNSEEVQQSLFNIRDNIDGKNEMVINGTVEEYFKKPLKGFDKWLEDNNKQTMKKVWNPRIKGYQYEGEPLTKSKREEYLKEYLDRFSETRYDEYIEWAKGDGTQNLPVDNEDYKKILNEQIEKRSKQAQEEYLRGVPQKLRQDALIMMPDIFGGAMNLQVEAESNADVEEWNELYNPNGDNPLRGFKQRRAKGRDGEWKLFTPPMGEAGSLDAGNKKYDENLKLQENYIKTTYDKYIADAKAYEDSVTAWNNKNNKFTTELNNLEADFKKLGSVTKDSSKQSIEAHNALVRKHEDLMSRMKAAGLDEKRSVELTNLQTSLKQRYDDLMDKSEKFQDISLASAALGLNYSFGERLALNLESSLADIGVLATGTMSALAEASRLLPGDQQEMEFYKHINDTYKASINYNESVKNEMQTSLPESITWETRKGNYGAYIADMFANNSASILTAIGSGGFGALATRGMVKAGAKGAQLVAQQQAAMQVRKKLMKAPMAIFFGLEGGAKLADMEISKKNAPKAIAFFNQELKRTDLTPAEREEILQLKDEQEKALNINQFQKAFSTIAYGGIAMYAERFGTLSYVNGLNRFAKTTAIEGVGKKMLYGSANKIFNVGIELFEETATQLGHNLIDITLLDQDKSMIDGIDTDFLVNVAFSSLAIQGPSMGMNSWNTIKGEVQSRQDRIKSDKLAAELSDIQLVLNQSVDLTTAERKELVKRKREILKEAALQDVVSMQRVSRMDSQEVTELFEINRENRKDIKLLRELGISGEEVDAIKKRKEEIVNRINKRNEKRETLLSRDDQRRRAKLKKFQEKGQITDGKLITDLSGKDIAQDLKTGKIVGTQEYLDPDAEFWLARHEYNEGIARGLGNSVLKFEGENARENVVKYLDNKVKSDITLEDGTIYTVEQQKADILEGYDDGAYGTSIGNDAILFENNIMTGIGAGGFAAKMAATTALHELLHIQNRKAGIVKDSKVVEEARTAVDEIRNRINELAELGEINKKDKIAIDKRIASYDGMTGVALEELINLAGDLKAAGIMGRESVSLGFAFKSFLNSVIESYNKIPKLKNLSTFFMFEDVDDVLRYIDSFQGKLAEGKIVIPPEEEIGEDIRESKAVTPLEAINDLLPKDIKTNEDYNNFLQDPRRFRAVFEATVGDGVISNYVKSKAIGDEYNDAIESVRDRLINFKPEAERADGTIVGKKGFGEFIFANTRFGKLDAKKALAIKAEETKRTKSIDTKEARQIEDTSTETTDRGPDTRRKKTNILKIGKVEGKADAIRKIVKVKPGDTFKEVSDNNTGKVAEEIFDVPAKKITDPKKNLTYAKKIKDGIPEPSEAGNIQTFYGDTQTAEKLIKILPTENVTSSDADINEVGENIDVDREVLGRGLGLTNRMLNYFYNKTNRRSKGKKSQPFIWELKPEFKNPTAEVVEQLQKDLGITPRGELNNYNRNIGQLLKGVAKFQAQQTALSTAQRILTEQKAPKKQIASVTAAQSKVAFSKAVDVGILNNGVVEQEFEMDDITHIDKLLKINNQKGIFRHRTSNEIDNWFDVFEKDIIANMPESVLPKSRLNTILRPSKRIFAGKKFGLEGKGQDKITITKGEYKGQEMTIDDYYKIKRKELLAKDLKYGPPFKGEGANYTYGKTYADLFGKTEQEIKESFDNGTVDAQNKINLSMHKQMWERIDKSIKDTKGKSLRAWGSWLSMVGQDTEHPHRMGAELLGYSKNPKGVKNKKGKVKLYEWEHAMPATRAYLYLLHNAVDKNLDFNTSYGLVSNNFKLIALDAAEDLKLKAAGRTTSMGQDWSIITDSWLDRYFKGNIGIDAKSIIGFDNKTFEDTYSIPKLKPNLDKTKKLNKASMFSRSVNKPKGITVLDFDDTLATTKSLVKYTTPDGKTGTLNAEEYASTYEGLLGQGYVFDFSEFNKVVKGKIAPLFQKALKLQGKFGPENMFVLTARPPQAAKAIFDFLKANGLNIPMKNITGLANSTAEAKALWIADKVGEGYNDFYFADDALQNVQAVDNMLEQFDVKRKVQQAKIKFSKNANTNFNNILEEVTGIEAKKRFSDVKARKRGQSKGKFRFFIPPSHEDFVGLLYNFMGKGKQGDGHRDFFEQNLIRPLNRAYREIDTAKQAIANDYKSLNKQFPDVKKKLTKKTPDGDFTFQDAIRVYLWNKHGYDIPGLSPTDQVKLSELVMNAAELQTYAETLNVISKQDNYVSPGQGWEGGNIKIDLIDATGRVGRAEYFTEFQENADLIFSEENLNKIEAAYGASFRSALEDMLHRIKTGVNRPKGQSGVVNKFMNYLNGSVGAVMFFNMRSAILQQMSIVNYLNFADNNMFAAAKAFANQKQYWKDFAYIFNSDMLKQRRGGIGTDINGAELAEAVSKSKNPTRAVIGKLLQFGFTPTQIGDNIAIAIGGSTFYRNRINKYLKDGFSQKEAETKAWTDFQDITQSTQQSARPDKTSQQQSMWIGKMVLNFQNITSQYNRLIKRSAQDIYNRRITKPNTTQSQSDISNMSRILYYGAIQNLIFYSLQTALFAVMFGDEDEENEKFLKKKERVINGTFDSILRGSGIYGVAVSTLKNMAIKWHEQREKKYNPDESAVLMEALNFSPVVGIKARKLVNAEKTINYNESVISEMETLDADNPGWSAATNYIEALTNFPANRLYQKSINLRNSLDNDYKAWQRALFFSGYTTWSLGLEDTKKMQVIKETVKTKKKEASKEKAKIRREEKKKIDLKEKEAKGIEKQKQEKKEGKQVTCLVCKLPIEKGKKYCTIHEKVDQRKDGKKRQCRKYKSNGKRCNMQTASKSGYCYYHD